MNNQNCSRRSKTSKSRKDQKSSPNIVFIKSNLHDTYSNNFNERDMMKENRINHHHNQAEAFDNMSHSSDEDTEDIVDKELELRRHQQE